VPGRVLLTDGQERSAVAAARSLAARGYQVGAAAHRSLAAGNWSSSCAQSFRVTDPRRSLRDHAAEIGAIAKAHDYGAVITGSDAGLLALSRHRDLLPPAVRHGLPDAEVVEDCLLKTSLAAHAERAGIACPTTIVCDRLEQAKQAAQVVGYPLMLKPRRTIFATGEGIVQRPSILIADEDALIKRFDKYGSPCLIQRRELGGICSFAGVVAEGALVAWVFSHYERTWPATAGPVSLAITAEPPAELVASVGALLRDLGWQGLFELELIERAPAEFGAIDFNPRLYGSLALGCSAGVPLAAIWADRLHGRPARPLSAAPGHTYRWGDADLRHALYALRKGSPRRFASILTPRAGTTHPYFGWRDPAPLVARGLEIARNRWHRVRRGEADEPWTSL